MADCINLNVPDPDVCATASGGDAMSVDLVNDAFTPAAPSGAFVRFDLDGTLTGKSIISAAFELRATNGASADSVSSGELWQVAAFTRADLFSGAPAQQGALLGADLGNVAKLQTISWPIPATSISSNGSLYFGVFPLNNNGTDYFNLQGATPPRLVVTYQ